MWCLYADSEDELGLEDMGVGMGSDSEDNWEELSDIDVEESGDDMAQKKRSRDSDDDDEEEEMDESSISDGE